MDISEIQKIIANDEHRTLELKKTTGELKDAMHTACAMLNTDGGWLIFGVAPQNLNVIGQQVTDSTQREIALALSHIEPIVNVFVEYIDIPSRPGNKLIAIHLDGWVSGKEPYTYHGCPYYKVESTTKEMPRQMFEERLRMAQPQKFSWEQQPAEGYDLSSLNEKQILNAVRLGVRGGRMPESAISLPIDDILQRFSLVREGHLLQAAVALFGQNLHNYPQMVLRMARFRGVDKNEFVDNQRLSGNFFDLLDAGIAFCYKHLNIHGKIEGLQRDEFLDVPVEALREAIINALCHRSYESLSSTVSLAIYDDRIEICNPGRFPLGITPDNIKQSHESHPFNPIMASVLYKSTWLENWGSGISRMVNACQKHNVPEPYYEIRNDNTIAIVFKKSIVDCGSDCGSGYGNDNISKLTDRQKVILSAIIHNPKETARHLAVVTKVSLRSIENDLSYLHKNGFIQKETNDNRSPWIVLKNK